MARLDESAAIFSPSVARIAASTARDWSHVESWLASKFPTGRSLPPFERSQDTLKTLLALAAANEAADDRRRLLVRADVSALQALIRACESPHRVTDPDARGLRPDHLRDDLDLVQH